MKNSLSHSGRPSAGSAMSITFILSNESCFSLPHKNLALSDSKDVRGLVTDA